MGIPYVAFGNDELNNADKLGKTITCDKCGKRHRVKTIRSKTGNTTLQVYRCKGNVYMCGINGVDIRGIGNHGTYPTCGQQ